MRIVYQTLSSFVCHAAQSRPRIFHGLVQAGDSQPMHLQTPAAARASYDEATPMLDAPGAASVATQDLSLPCADGPPGRREAVLTTVDGQPALPAVLPWWRLLHRRP
jgi:hypothetical protein